MYIYYHILYYHALACRTPSAVTMTSRKRWPIQKQAGLAHVCIKLLCVKAVTTASRTPHTPIKEFCMHGRPRIRPRARRASGTFKRSHQAETAATAHARRRAVTTA